MSETTITREGCVQRARSLATTPLDAYVTLDLRNAGDSAVTFFPVTSRFRVTLHSADLPSAGLRCDYLGRIVQVTVNGTDWPESLCEMDAGGVTITGLDTGVLLDVEVRGESTFSRTGQGLHRFVDPADNNTYLYSHCEPADARRIYPVFEQPDIKYILHTTMLVPNGWKAFANGVVEESRECEALEPGGVEVSFSPTRPLSSYLTAFAAGPYVGEKGSWTDPRSGRTIELGAWCRASMRPYFDPENVLRITHDGLGFFSDLFDYEYPWAHYDSVFVPEYNLGAMENPGLVTFTERYIFRDPPTAADRAARANTILHELSHMWFGDLVTPQWWDDLWLKESFAEYMGALASVAVTEHQDAWVNFSGARVLWALRQDSLSTTHPIAADIPDVEAASQNFDGITYAKGAAVLRQLVHYVGEDAFTHAARSYFKKHEFSTATFGDLIAELEEASGESLSDWVERWLCTSGCDTARATLGADGSLSIEVDGDPVRPHRIDIGVYRPEAAGITRCALVDARLSGASTAITSPDLPEDLGDCLVVINDQAHSYLRGVFRDTEIGILEGSLSRIEDPLTRTVAWLQLIGMVDNAELDPAVFLRVLMKNGWAEDNATTASMIRSQGLACVSSYSPDHLVGARAEDLRHALAADLAAAEAGSDQQRIAAGYLISAELCSGASDAPRRLRELLQTPPEGLELGPSQRWDILGALRGLNALDDEELAHESARDDTLTGRVRALGVSLSAPDAAVKKEIITQVTVPRRLSNAEVKGLINSFLLPGVAHQRARREALSLGWYLDNVETWWAEHPLEIAREIVVGLFPETGDADTTVSWLEQHPQIPGGLRRLVQENADRKARIERVLQRYGA